MKKAKILFSLIFLLYSTNAFSFEKQAQDFIIKTTDSAKKIILNTTINELQKKKSLENLALNSVDVSGLAKYTLGEEIKN